MTVRSPSIQTWSDALAIGISATCLVHCLALPVAVALIPAASRWLDLPESIHLWLLLAAAPLSSAVLITAWRKRPGAGATALALGFAGLTGLAGGLALAGSAIEPVVTSAGAILLASAHLLNWRRRIRCGP